MTTRLAWLPTWHQARVLCEHFRVSEEEIARAFSAENARTVGQDVLLLYRLLLQKLE